MNFAILINLDYERLPNPVCTHLWDEVESQMQAAGFTKHKRLFFGSGEYNDVVRTARRAVADAENQLSENGLELIDAVREFFCFEYTQVNDLLLPNSEEVKVDYVDPLIFFSALDPQPLA